MIFDIMMSQTLKINQKESNVVSRDLKKIGWFEVLVCESKWSKMRLLDWFSNTVIHEVSLETYQCENHFLRIHYEMSHIWCPACAPLLNFYLFEPKNH